MGDGAAVAEVLVWVGLEVHESIIPCEPQAVADENVACRGLCVFRAMVWRERGSVGV